MRMHDAAEVEALFRADQVDAASFSDLMVDIGRTGSLLKAHVRLTDQEHVPYFLRFGQLAYDRQIAAKIAGLARKLSVLDGGPCGLVLGAESSPRYLAKELARSFSVEAALVALGDDRRPVRSYKNAPPVLPRRDTKVVVVADVLTSGNTVSPIVELARETSDNVVVVTFATVGRRGAEISASLGVPVAALIHGNWAIANVQSCPLCLVGPPIPALELY